jgi:hypothetical protein
LVDGHKLSVASSPTAGCEIKTESLNLAEKWFHVFIYFLGLPSFQLGINEVIFYVTNNEGKL